MRCPASSPPLPALCLLPVGKVDDDPTSDPWERMNLKGRSVFLGGFHVVTVAPEFVY